MNVERPVRDWTVLVVNHSHTDIGFTAEQNIIKAHHVNYIRQVLKILSQEEAVGIEDGYEWNCETFRSVEEFLNKASLEEINNLYISQFFREIGFSTPGKRILYTMTNQNLGTILVGLLD
ncbi:MAG: hypothetical protein PWR10_2386 [Halanaerobiales bacterium]|nr:hypothetical protein [Halanaerobiales bacterium]